VFSQYKEDAGSVIAEASGVHFDRQDRALLEFVKGTIFRTPPPDIFERDRHETGAGIQFHALNLPRLV